MEAARGPYNSKAAGSAFIPISEIIPPPTPTPCNAHRPVSPPAPKILGSVSSTWREKRAMGLAAPAPRSAPRLRAHGCGRREFEEAG